MIVDDEEIVLTSLQSLLRLDTDYRVVTFRSPVEALAELQKHPVDAVISDFLMPQMNGLQFLAEVKRLYPSVPRILLTGYADKGNAINAINEVGLYQYIEKPWDNDHIKLVLRNSLATKSLEETLQQKLRELDEVLRHRDALATREGMLRQELDLARQVQQNLLPRRLPEANGVRIAAKYEPVLEIGGDYYDIQELDESRLGILVADATGHGIQAALSTALLKFAFSTLIKSGQSLAEIVTGMNEILGRGLPENSFVAAIVAILDKRQMSVEIINAGLPHPLIWRRAATTVERVAANGLFLGIDLPLSYCASEATTVSLGPGDRLLLYSDGLSEVPGRDGRFFGDASMIEEIERHAATPLEQLLDWLLQSSRDFCDGSQEPDDTTIVAIETI